MNREEWLYEAAQEINAELFEGRNETSQLQISIGRTRGKALGHTMLVDYDKQDVGLDDFFPPTVFISPLIKEPIHILAAITHELIHAYETKSTKHNKLFKATAKNIGFDGVGYEMTDALEADLKRVLDTLESKFGKYPGIAIKQPEKAKTENKKQSNTIVYFCPECGYEVKVTRKMMLAHPGFPTCCCGTKMGIANDDSGETTEEQ